MAAGSGSTRPSLAVRVLPVVHRLKQDGEVLLCGTRDTLVGVGMGLPVPRSDSFHLSLLMLTEGTVSVYTVPCLWAYFHCACVYDCLNYLDPTSSWSK